MTRLIIDAPLQGGRTISIEGDELHYLTKVRRSRPGERVEIVDSHGKRFWATVSSVGRSSAIIELHDELADESPISPIRLIVSIPKHNLLDDIIKKVSEIGVESLVPVVASRTNLQAREGRHRRWKKIAREAMRQCGRATPLNVHPITPFQQALGERSSAGTKLLFHVSAKHDALNSILGLEKPAPPVEVAIGPEGGFTEDEVAFAEERGYRPVTLGLPILRIETAAIAASVLCAAILQRPEPSPD